MVILSEINNLGLCVVFPIITGNYAFSYKKLQVFGRSSSRQMVCRLCDKMRTDYQNMSVPRRFLCAESQATEAWRIAVKQVDKF